MPKMKTNSGAKKRFRVTGKGRIKRKRAFHRHILECKNSKRGRRMRKTAYVSDADMKSVMGMLAS